MAVIDLSRLPPPDVIEALSFDAVFAEAKADLIARDATLAPVLALESEPLTKLLQVFAYREVLIRNRVNQAARARMIAFATGADLDHTVALLGVERLVITPADPVTGAEAVLESDEDLRRRYLLAPSSFSVAGPEAAYVFHALSADAAVLDASATSPAPGEVIVSVLARTEPGTAPAELLATVAARVSADTVRPLTDHVTVQSADIFPYEIVATIHTYEGPDSSIVMAQAQTNAEAYAVAQRRMGRDITLSGVYAALHVAGVQRVDLISPAADIPIGRTQASFCTDIALTFGGLDE